MKSSRSRLKSKRSSLRNRHKNAKLAKLRNHSGSRKKKSKYQFVDI